MREEGEGFLGEGFVGGVVRRTCEAESARPRHGIFSRLTTGRDTLHREDRQVFNILFRNLKNIKQANIFS